MEEGKSINSVESDGIQPVLEKNIKSSTLEDNSLVEVAVDFLKNPKIVDQPDQYKITFLKKKGLSDNQIQQAMAMIPIENSISIKPPLPLHMSARQPPSVWDRLRNVTSSFLFITGVYFGCQFLIKSYIKPFLTGEPANSERDSVLEVQESVMSVLVQIQKTLEKMSLSIEEQNKAIKNNSAIDSSQSQKTYVSVQKLISEMSSLKSLLINKQSFSITPASSPALPLWQTQLKAVENGVSKENSVEIQSISEDNKINGVEEEKDVAQNSIEIAETNGSATMSESEYTST